VLGSAEEAAVIGDRRRQKIGAELDSVNAVTLGSNAGSGKE
jgi:hypothetical protein